MKVKMIPILIWCAWGNRTGLLKGLEEFEHRNQRMRENNQDYSIMKIGFNTEKNS